MTDQTTAELIEEAKSRAELCDADTREAMRDTGNVIVRLAVALEAAEKRAEGAERERDQYAAVVEEVRAEATRTPPSGFGYYLPSGSGLRTILASAPADALREVKAEAWQEGAHRVYNSTLDEAEWWWSDWASENPYKAREGKP